MAKEASHWFADKLPFKMKTPTFKDQRVSLLGGRLSRIQRGPKKASIPAAHLIYSVGAHKLSVLVFDGDGMGEMQPATAAQGLGQPFEVHEVRDHRVAFYRRGGLTYAVTSKLPRKQLVELLGSSL
jgi:anti-sigma factor RsiW